MVARCIDASRDANKLKDLSLMQNYYLYFIQGIALLSYLESDNRFYIFSSYIFTF